MFNDMEQIQAGDQTLRYDRQRTIEAYASIVHGDAEECGCSHCRNFAAQRDKAYPSGFRRLLESLGVDVEKEGEVYECGGNETVRLYGGWFYFAGLLVEAGERLTEPNDDFNYYFVDAKRLPKPPVDFGEDTAAVEFNTKIPWILAGERP